MMDEPDKENNTDNIAKDDPMLNMYQPAYKDYNKDLNANEENVFSF